MPARSRTGADPRFPISFVEGHLTGLKPSQLKGLERLGRRRVPVERVVSPELAQAIAALSAETGRQVGVMLSRRGSVERVLVGTPQSTTIPDLGRARAGRGRLRGLRFVHTRLDANGLTHEDLTDLALLRLDLVATVEVIPAQGRDEARAGTIEWAHLVPSEGDESPWQRGSARSAHELTLPFDATVRAIEEEFERSIGVRGVDGGPERAFLVSVTRHGAEAASASMDELERIAVSAGLEVVDRVVQRRERADPRTVLGKGRAQDLAIRAMQQGVELLVFDQELTPSQGKALSALADVKILDRTGLILDVFAQRARSRDGRLQVELAQLRYRMPHLEARDDALSRLAGGIGGRGPGETRLEIDRRRARDRIARLEREVKKISRQRGHRRTRRARNRTPVVSLVGYTNAGKSSLLNALTESEVFTEDRLFATLDPTSRSLTLPSGRDVVLTDTVGFIRDLPADLVSAFRATLEELDDADLLLHVVDGSSPAAVRQFDAVERTLDDLGLTERPQLVVLNKSDAADPEEIAALQRQLGGVILSALRRDGLSRLTGQIERALDRPGPFTGLKDSDDGEEDPRGHREPGRDAEEPDALSR